MSALSARERVLKIFKKASERQKSEASILLSAPELYSSVLIKRPIEEVELDSRDSKRTEIAAAAAASAEVAADTDATVDAIVTKSVLACETLKSNLDMQQEWERLASKTPKHNHYPLYHAFDPSVHSFSSTGPEFFRVYPPDLDSLFPTLQFPLQLYAYRAKVSTIVVCTLILPGGLFFVFSSSGFLTAHAAATTYASWLSRVLRLLARDRCENWRRAAACARLASREQGAARPGGRLRCQVRPHGGPPRSPLCRPCPLLTR
jgi:hypothetical protein